MFPLLDSLFNNPLDFLREALYRVPAILLALILHEWAHGYVAYRLGDPTAKMMGRLSLNPLHHLDPVGTILMLVAGFGWAKPVPINPNNFSHPRRDDFLVSIAGITMNILLFAVFFTIGYVLFEPLTRATMAAGSTNTIQYYLLQFIFTTAIVNLSIAIFNLIPIPPLDGSHVLNDLILKGNLFVKRKTAQLGMGLLMLLSFTGILGKGMGIVVNWVWNGASTLLASVFGG